MSHGADAGHLRLLPEADMSSSTLKNVRTIRPSRVLICGTPGLCSIACARYELHLTAGGGQAT